MEKKEVSTFLLSLISTLSLLNNKEDIIDQLLKGLNSVYEKAEFDFCCDDEPDFSCFKFYNGEWIITRYETSQSNHDYI